MSEIEHPCFERTQPMGPLTLATFVVPKMPISVTAIEFDRAARALVEKFKADLQQISGGLNAHREFGGGVSLPYVHHICTKPAAERFSDEDVAAMHAAVQKAFPNATQITEWHNQCNGWPGYSIRFKEVS